MFKTKLRKSAGFSMLEVLVALLVLSIGLLGVATLQVRGQQFTQVGYLRTQATFMAYDIMERMRINSDNIPNNGNADDGFYQNEPTSLLEDCDVDDCTPIELATYDLIKWHNLVGETLPEGDANIVWFTEDTNPADRNFDSGTEDTIIDNEQLDSFYTITIQWANIIDRDDGAPLEEQQWILQVQL